MTAGLVPVRLGLLAAIDSILPPGPERSDLDRTLRSATPDELANVDELLTFDALLALAEAVDNVIDTAATSVTKSLAAGYYRELTAIAAAHARDAEIRAESANPAGEVPIAPVPDTEAFCPPANPTTIEAIYEVISSATERANPRITRISFGTDTAEVDYEDTPDLDDDEDDVVDVCDWLDRLATRLGDHLTAGDRRHLAALRSYLADQNTATVKAELDPLDHLPTRDGDLLRLADGPDGEGVVIATHVRRIDSRLNRGEGPPTITVSTWPHGDPEDIDFVTVSFPTPDAADAYFRRLVALIPDTRIGASIAAQLDNTPPAVTPEPVDAGPRPDYPRRSGDKIELSEHFTVQPAYIEEYGSRPDNDPGKVIVFVAVRARPGHGPARYYLPPAPVAEARRYLDELRDLIINSPAPAAPPAGTDLTRIFAELMERRFHETYERLAPTFGYETRPESAVPWDQVPEQNRELMVAVCAELLGQNTAGRPLGDDR